MTVTDRDCDLSHGSDQDRESQCVEIFTNRTVVQFYAQYSTHACPLSSISGCRPQNGFTRAIVLAGRSLTAARARGEACQWLRQLGSLESSADVAARDCSRGSSSGAGMTAKWFSV